MSREGILALLTPRGRKRSILSYNWRRFKRMYDDTLRVSRLVDIFVLIQ